MGGGYRKVHIRAWSQQRVHKGHTGVRVQTEVCASDDTATESHSSPQEEAEFAPVMGSMAVWPRVPPLEKDMSGLEAQPPSYCHFGLGHVT